ncbi:NADPH-dependent F420 reductase [Pseudoxanthomonas sp. UTMC 1351]|uniref:NADPH-dependent F420 reductase n=1 Tax=Pseudoxanthomonas sp. UTMC 1351 TaxID=2695853 RepID=UPI0034CDE30C
MSYAIIGFGNIGQALAKAFARSGIEVSVATTRDPESFAAEAAAIGPTIIPKTLAEAVKADIVFLAVRYESHPDVAKVLPNWQGKTIVDVTNTRVPPEELGASLLPRSSRRLSAEQNWLRASTIWSLPSSTKTRPYRVAGESCSWRATMTAQQRRLVRLRKTWVSRRSNLAGYRKADCLCRRAEIAGAN